MPVIVLFPCLFFADPTGFVHNLLFVVRLTPADIGTESFRDHKGVGRYVVSDVRDEVCLPFLIVFGFFHSVFSSFCSSVVLERVCT